MSKRKPKYIKECKRNNYYNNSNKKWRIEIYIYICNLWEGEMDKRLSLKLFRIISILTLLLSFINIPVFASAKTVPAGDGNLSIDSSKLYVQVSNGA